MEKNYSRVREEVTSDVERSFRAKYDGGWKIQTSMVALAAWTLIEIGAGTARPEWENASLMDSIINLAGVALFSLPYVILKVRQQRRMQDRIEVETERRMAE